MVGAGVCSGTSDFRSRSRPKKWRLPNTGGNRGNFLCANQSISCRRQSLCVNRGNLPWSGDLLLDNVSGVEAALLAQAGCHQAATDDQQEQHHSSQQFSPQHNSSSRNIDSLTTQLQPVPGLVFWAGFLSSDRL